MIKTIISSYIDKKYLSVDLEIEDIEIANINIENETINIDIYKTSEMISIELNEFLKELSFAKEELIKTYPELKLS